MAQTITTLIDAIQSKRLLSTLCAQTNAQPDYSSLLSLESSLSMRSSERIYIDKCCMTTNVLVPLYNAEIYYRWNFLHIPRVARQIRQKRRFTQLLPGERKKRKDTFEQS